MTVKEWLSSYKRITARIRLLQRDIDKLTAEIEKASGRTDGMPRGSSPSTQMERIAIELAELKTEKEQAIRESWQCRERIEAVIMAVEDPIYMTLLHDRYIELMSWNEITDDLRLINDQYVRGKLHQKALNEVRKVIASAREKAHEK